jgi:meiotically up-regulated gene 157 (Mug157) protein
MICQTPFTRWSLKATANNTALTSRTSPTALKWLRDSTGGTHFMHESFWKDDPTKYTRPWFAWANTLFGEMILHIAQQKPAVLQSFS